MKFLRIITKSNATNSAKHNAVFLQWPRPASCQLSVWEDWAELLMDIWEKGEGLLTFVELCVLRKACSPEPVARLFGLNLCGRGEEREMETGR